MARRRDGDCLSLGNDHRPVDCSATRKDSGESVTELTPKFRERFPEFGWCGDSAIETMLELAGEMHSLSETATLYLAGHLIKLDREEGRNGVDEGAGVVTNESIGPKTVQYKTQAERESDVFFERTPYGRMFLVLEKRATAFSVRVY